jgi:hypothetical protein
MAQPVKETKPTPPVLAMPPRDSKEFLKMVLIEHSIWQLLRNCSSMIANAHPSVSLIESLESWPLKPGKMYPENLPERGTAYLYFYSLYFNGKLVQPLYVGYTINTYNRHSNTATYPQLKLSDVEDFSKMGFEVKMSFVPMDLCDNQLKGPVLDAFIITSAQLGYNSTKQKKAKEIASSHAAKAIENLFLAYINFPCNKINNGGYWRTPLMSTLHRIADRVNDLRKANGANRGERDIIMGLAPSLYLDGSPMRPHDVHELCSRLASCYP